MKNQVIIVLFVLLLEANTLTHSRFLQETGKQFPSERHWNGKNFYFQVRLDRSGTWISFWLEDFDADKIYQSLFSSDEIVLRTNFLTSSRNLFEALSSPTKTESISLKTEIQLEKEGFSFIVGSNGLLTLKIQNRSFYILLAHFFNYQSRGSEENLKTTLLDEFGEQLKQRKDLREEVRRLMNQGSRQNSQSIENQIKELNQRAQRVSEDFSFQDDQKNKLKSQIGDLDARAKEIQERLLILEEGQRISGQIKTVNQNLSQTFEIAPKQTKTNFVANIDEDSPYYDKFRISGDRAVYIGQVGVWTQLLGSVSIASIKTWSIRIQRTYGNLILFGVIDYNYRAHRFSFHQQNDLPNNIFLTGWGTGVYDAGVIYQNEGFGEGDLVEMNVDLKQGVIEWKINGDVKVRHRTARLTLPIAWVPYVAFKETGDAIA